jgi:hypothetical protein
MSAHRTLIMPSTAGLKARKRAQFAAAVRCITDLDDDGLRLVLGYIPAWVKFSEYERARFLNDSLQLLWPAFDRAICNLLKAELEPLLQVGCLCCPRGHDRINEWSWGTR